MNQESRIKNKIKSIIHYSLFIIRKAGGFTLIELLVAIGIIGILSSFLLVNFIGVRQRARDGVRKSDLRQIQAALELYRSDQSKYPPPNGTGLGNHFPGQACITDKTTGSSLVSGGTTYMQKIPCDPSYSAWNNGAYSYFSDANGSTYILGACLENANDADPNVTSDEPVSASNGCQSQEWFVVKNP